MSTRALDDPVLEQRRVDALALIRQYGDPALRTPTEAVTVFDDALRAEAERMGTIMQDARGVGLASPQLGRLTRLLVMRAAEDEPVIALCNPEVTWRSEEEETEGEGCLSIGEVMVDVVRAVAVRVSAQDVSGAPVELELEGYAARVAQHEIDHLNGVLMLDRTTPEQRREALRALRATPPR
jgi:peptide deformylase